MTRTRRALALLALAILLVGMQCGAQWHALQHVGEALKHTPAHSFTVPDDEVCALCALFAGGAHAVADEVDLYTPPATQAAHGTYAPSLNARAAPHFYNSRAPPAAL